MQLYQIVMTHKTEDQELFTEMLLAEAFNFAADLVATLTTVDGKNHHDATVQGEYFGAITFS